MDMVNQDVGGVKKKPGSDAEGDQAEPTKVENYVAKKTVGVFLDLAGMATLNLSPITLLAITSDLAYGSTTYLKELADKEHVNLFEISSAMTMYSLNQVSTATKGALTTVRVTGNLLDKHIFDHYWQGAAKIGREGIYSVAAESGQPYLDAFWYNFSSDRPTLTENIVSGKMLGNVWAGLSEWFGKKDERAY